MLNNFERVITNIKQPTKRRENCSRTTSGSCNQLQPASVGGGGGLNGTKKFNSGLQITTLEVNIYHY